MSKSTLKPTLAILLAATAIPLPKKAFGQALSGDRVLEDADSISHSESSSKDWELEPQLPSATASPAPTTAEDVQFSATEPVEIAPPPEIIETELSQPSQTANAIAEPPEHSARTIPTTNDCSQPSPSNCEETQELSQIPQLETFEGEAKALGPPIVAAPETSAIAAEFLQPAEVTPILQEANPPDLNPATPPETFPNAVEFGQPNDLEEPAKDVELPETEEPTEPTNEDPEYKISPRTVPNNYLPPSATTFSLNNVSISHLTEWEAAASDTFGDNINNQVGFNGVVRLNSELAESLTRDKIYTIEQNGHYLQLQTIRQSREVETSQTIPQTTLGFRIRMSLTAPCRFAQTEAGQQCTYTPGLVTDLTSIDPETLFPTRIFQPSRFGDVVTPESLAAIRQPGFQRGANGQEIGLDLFVPNAGTTEGNSQGDRSSIRREETVENAPVGIYSSVRQILRVNDREAVLGRTVRGVPIIVGDRNTLLNTALQLSRVLPDAEPSLESTGQPANTNVNRNLFLAANNARLPASSFTVYHAGMGRAKRPSEELTDLRQIPPASFNSVWLGISPVTERTFSTRERFERTGPLRVIAAAGAEGGVETNLDFLSLINGQAFSTKDLQNFYAQIYLQFFNQDVNRIASSVLREETNYYPHLSFTGNITGAEDVFRYYTGVITSETVKAYAGLDYSKVTADGWNFSVGGIGYINPDRDYYSQLRGSVSKRIDLSPTANIVLLGDINYGLDRETTIGETVIIDPASSLSAGVRANVGPASFGVVNFFGDVLPNSYDNTLMLDLGVNLGDRVYLSGYYTPINESSSRSRYGVKADFSLGSDRNSPRLTLGWASQEFDFGRDPSGNDLVQNDNVFTILFRMGGPRNPL